MPTTHLEPTTTHETRDAQTIELLTQARDESDPADAARLRERETLMTKKRRRRRILQACLGALILPAVAGASVLRWAARWSAAGSFTPAAVCASAIGIL